MSGDNVAFLPQQPIRSEALEREAQTAHTTLRDVSIGTRSESSKTELPKLAIVADSAEADRVENRFSKLGSLTADIKRSREEALANERRRSDRVPLAPPNPNQTDRVPLAPPSPNQTDRTSPNFEQKKPNLVEQVPERYDHNNIEQARERARKEGKNVVLEFGRNGCTWCTKQEQEMNKPEVRAAASDAIVVHINGSYASGLASKYGISGYPTTIVESSSGQIIYNHKGALGARDLISVLKMPPR